MLTSVVAATAAAAAVAVSTVSSSAGRWWREREGVVGVLFLKLLIFLEEKRAGTVGRTALLDIAIQRRAAIPDSFMSVQDREWDVLRLKEELIVERVLEDR